MIVLDVMDAAAGAVRICESAKRYEPAATVLGLVSNANVVPELLAAGCDSVLLRPFVPNLFYARVGRLMREREILARFPALRADRSVPGNGASGTNRFWPDQECPNCSTRRPCSFEFASQRRAWFACLQCNHVWIGDHP